MIFSQRLQAVLATVETGVLPLFSRRTPTGPAVASLIALVVAARAGAQRSA